jgi:hypothetical protein
VKLTEAMHWQLIRSIREDERLLGVYLDALEEDGRYPLLVLVGRQGLPPVLSRHRRPRWLAGGGNARLRRDCTTLETAPVALQLKHCRGGKPPGKWLLLVDFAACGTATRYIQCPAQEMAGLLREGFTEAADRWQIAWQLIGPLDEALTGRVSEVETQAVVEAFARSGRSKEELRAFLAERVLCDRTRGGMVRRTWEQMRVWLGLTREGD